MSTFRLTLPHVLMAVLLLCTANLATAQRNDRRQDRDDRREVRQTERDGIRQIKDRAVKEARKQARRYAREGWFAAPGSLPLEKQLERTWVMLYDMEGTSPKHIQADGNGVANTQTAAQIQAFEMAKLNLAGQIQTEVRALVEANIANQQLTQEEAATVNRVLTTSRNIIATRLNRIDPALVMYRRTGDRGDNVECQVMLIYERNTAIRQASDVIRQELDRDLRDLSRRWDNMLGLDIPPANTPAPEHVPAPSRP